RDRLRLVAHRRRGVRVTAAGLVGAGRLLRAPQVVVAHGVIVADAASADSQAATSLSRLALVSSGAQLAAIDIRARSASVSSDSSWAARIVAYCAASREPNSSGSSAPRATVTPAASSSGSGTEVRSE